MILPLLLIGVFNAQHQRIGGSGGGDTVTACLHTMDVHLLVYYANHITRGQEQGVLATGL